MSDNKSIFERVIVIGYGTVTSDVLKLVHSISDKYGYSTEYIEHEVHEFNTAKKYCVEQGLTLNTIEDKSLLTEYFGKISEPTLIISASNNYLIPKSILDSEYVTAMNFHNALLPKFPGRNAPSWVIYEGEAVTGITWHYVTSRVDAGGIIIQKQIPIGEDVKAYELAGQLMILAFEAFSECYEDVIMGKAKGNPQSVEANRKMYLSKDVPGNGEIDINDSWDIIYRTLRATDYAKYDIFPSIRVKGLSKEAIVARYKLTDREKAKSGEDYLIIPATEGKVLQIKYKCNN